MNHYKPETKIGYLGGGQLARMLAMSASHMGLKPHILSADPKDPAAQVSGFWTQGDLGNLDDLRAFIEQMDITTFESEFLDSAKLSFIKKETRAKIWPSPKIMGLLQDRKTQKHLFDQNDLPTSVWKNIESKQDLVDFIEVHSLPIVLKKRFFGYDGYGTFIIKTSSELKKFLKKDFAENIFIVEKFIPFKKEAAVIVARSSDKSFTHFPFVESHQKDARCDWIKGPIKGKAYSEALKKIKKFLSQIQYVGVMGIEFFVTNHGLIINEIAPRVHNTGHYTESATELSQFDVHNMCLLGESLPKEIKALTPGFAMVNLIGSGKKVKIKSVSGLHWYGKQESRKGRKMGHINALGSNPSIALRTALKKREDQKI